MSMDKLKNFFETIVPTLKIGSKNVRKHDMALQKLLDLEVKYFSSGNVPLDAKRLALSDKSTEFGQLIDNCYHKQMINMQKTHRSSEKDNIDPMHQVHVTVTRKDLEKVRHVWAAGTCDKCFSSDLVELIFVLTFTWKTLVSCGAVKTFVLKSLSWTHEADDDPAFVGIVVSQGCEKKQSNSPCPSCTTRDKNPLLCAQCDLACLVVRKSCEIGDNMSFLEKDLAPENCTCWGNIDLIANKKSTSNMGQDYQKLFSKSNAM